MAHLKDLIVNGTSRFLGPVYGKISNAYSADTVVGGTSGQFLKSDGSKGVWQSVAFPNTATTITGTGYLGGGGNLSANRTITHNEVHTATGQTSPTANQNLTWNSTVNVPVVKYDKAGHITAVTTTTLTMPSNPNTDTATTLNGHYTPASSTTKTSSTNYGIATLYMDAKGHVTGVGNTAHKVEKDVPSDAVFTDTHYTNYFAVNGNATQVVKYTQNGDKTLTITGSTFASVTPDATNAKITIGVNTGTTSSTVSRGDHTHAYSPTNHASTATTYGLGTSASTYGHVQLKTGDLKNQTYADGVAAAAAHTHSQYLTSFTETQLSKGTTSTGTTAAKAAVADISVSNHQITLTTTPKIYSASTADSATVATKLGSTTVGGTTTPIYLNAGVPTALSYTIAKSVPSTAVFTDTEVTQSVTTAATSYRPVILGATYNSNPGALTATTTGQVYVANNVYVQPALGLLNTTVQQVAEKVQMQYNATNECLDFVFI